MIEGIFKFMEVVNYLRAIKFKSWLIFASFCKHFSISESCDYFIGWPGNISLFRAKCYLHASVTDLFLVRNRILNVSWKGLMCLSKFSVNFVGCGALLKKAEPGPERVAWATRSLVEIHMSWAAISVLLLNRKSPQNHRPLTV